MKRLNKKAVPWMDGILIGAVVLVAVVWLLVLKQRSAGTDVQVTVDGTVVGTFSLSEDTVWSIPAMGKNILVIENGKARMQAADCPDLICVHHAAIFRVGESIICLPHKVVVSIIGQEAEVDATV